MTTGPGPDRPAIVLPVAVFLLATFAFAAALLVLQQQTGVDPNLISLVQFGPAFATATVVLAFRRSSACAERRAGWSSLRWPPWG